MIILGTIEGRVVIPAAIIMLSADITLATLYLECLVPQLGKHYDISRSEALQLTRERANGVASVSNP
jgi:hypothetical protein